MSKLKQPNASYDVAAYWEGIENGFREKAASLKKASGHHGAAGAAIEDRFRKVLAEYLPRRYVLMPGFVVNAEQERSPNMDLLISDCMHIPPLSVEQSHTAFACESVAAAIEITSGPRGTIKRASGKTTKLEDDLRKLAKVRKLGENRKYQDQIMVTTPEGRFQLATRTFAVTKPGPRAFLVTCGDEWANAATYERNLVAALRALKDEGTNVWLHAAYSVAHGLLTFKPYSDFEGEWRQTNALLDFVLYINQLVGSFPTYQIDLGRYRSAPQSDGTIIGSPAEFVHPH